MLHTFGIHPFWPSIPGLGFLFKNQHCNLGNTQYRRHDPSKGEGTPPIPRKLRIGMGGRGRGKNDLGSLELIGEIGAALSFCIIKDLDKFPMTGMPQLQHGNN